MMSQGIGSVLIVVGLVLVVSGILARYGFLDWFGHLPVDIAFKGEHSAFYFPITTMIVISIVLSLIASLFRKF